jgi:hypothetical protein
MSTPDIIPTAPNAALPALLCEPDTTGQHMLVRQGMLVGLVLDEALAIQLRAELHAWLDGRDRALPADMHEIRAALAAAVERLGLRPVARSIGSGGVSPTNLRKTIAGANPYAKTLARYREWYAGHTGAEASG